MNITRPRPRHIVIFSTIASVLVLALWIRLGPLPADFIDRDMRVSTRILARDGTPLYEALSSGGTRSEWIDAGSIPESVLLATRAAEDHRFFSHIGVDPFAVARAAWRNARAGRTLEGGSTITQQVVKQLRGQRRRSFSEKLVEAVLAVRLEHRLSKREVLALYLNLAPFGNQLVGVASASRGYFGIPPSNLTLAQAALLSGIPRSPTHRNPLANFSAAVERQRAVLDRLDRLRLVDPQQIAIARAERIVLRASGQAFVAPHFVQKILDAGDGRRASRIETTLDPVLQKQIAGIIAFRREVLRRHGAGAIAVAVLDNKTGEWLAWEGSGNYMDVKGSGAIDGVVTPRQAGSTLKPFTYALAFENGFTPASVLPDVPSSFETAVPGVVYAPKNYDGVFRGPMRARMALAGSENVPAVALLARLGVPQLMHLLRSAGFSTLNRTADHYGLGLTLGGAEIRLDELVTAYASLARGGIPIETRGIRRVSFAGKVHAPAASWTSRRGVQPRVISARSAYWITDILSDPRAREFVFGSGGSLEFPFPVAVKTGTSQAYRDNWTVGYSREVTVGVWVGNFDRTELRNSSGVTGAAPIFHEVMLAAQERVGRIDRGEDDAIVARDPNLQLQSICSLSGELVHEFCPQAEEEWLPSEAPGAVCSWHGVPRGRSSNVALPAFYHSWGRERGMETVLPTSQSLAVGSVGSGGKQFRIESPAAGSVYLIDPTLRKEFQAVSLRAVSPRATTIRWRVDGREVGISNGTRDLEWPLEPGEHTIIADGGKDASDSVTISVR
ncbi:MAG TPA: penicillin-binding protein 1C [Thermoanaerobaculia bacterium]|nr:penicillin-binding protein 1C [Thermoanaerobaculia bacterium]